MKPVYALARGLVALIAAAVAVGGCGSAPGAGAKPGRSSSAISGVSPAVAAASRPVGRGPRFQPSATGAVVGLCARRLGPRLGVHVEVFAVGRVVLVAAGIGVWRPGRLAEGRIARARCYGELVTLEPTGLVLVRPGTHPRLSDMFRAWGQPLSDMRLAGFTASAESRVEVFVGGHRWKGSPAGVPLTRHSEIVLELGPYVPPHRAYLFPAGT